VVYEKCPEMYKGGGAGVTSHINTTFEEIVLARRTRLAGLRATPPRVTSSLTGASLMRNDWSPVRYGCGISFHWFKNEAAVHFDAGQAELKVESCKKTGSNVHHAWGKGPEEGLFQSMTAPWCRTRPTLAPSPSPFCIQGLASRSPAIP
jgi:hypothetical protein